MITGTLCFDVSIEPQVNEEAVNELSAAIAKAINAVIGVDCYEHVDDNLLDDEASEKGLE